ncbi:type 1 glutamine amidotransferase [Jatrophihabitans endophyticus]|uniref:type 1 glutamine amidotransferase n=1 Tax=Jatrophihabitans endophyticus TaxID=1206085 RepID=UPI0019F834BB|nr:type 1 glutamine amidotransferase [Jatrophihabitans endophyticus]MBE7190130.1 type 1 glutamine amidotransferase [Jatrophihabitans endophyticus]
MSPRVLVVQPADSDPVGRLGEWLTAAGLELEIVDGPDTPPTLEGFAGLVVLGGPMGANDDAEHPWLATVKALLREAVRDEVPTLAVCLGAQLLAAANGGVVHPDPDGPELGAQLIAKRTSAATDPLFRSMPITPDVIQWHYDTIATLPPGAVQLASSPVCANEAFRLGRLAWGVQFHIETTPDVVRAWAAKDAARLPDYDLDALVARAVGVHDDVAEVWEPFAQSFADVVRDPGSVPDARGPAVSTAEPVTDPAAIRAALAAELGATRSTPNLGMPGVGRPADD